MSTIDKAQKRLTKAFIDTQPVTVVLTPREKAEKPSGGYAWVAGEPREPQVMRLIEEGSIPLPVVTVDGQQLDTAFELLGEADSIIEQEDVFELDGFSYRVTRVAHFNGWERRALVTKTG